MKLKNEIKNLLNRKTLSVSQIAKKHGVDDDQIEKQLEIGMKIEREHSKHDDAAREIALDHLGERPDYYKKLKQHVEK